MDPETTTILIDTALASGAATAIDPEERRLQELVLAIRGDAPVAEADFALRMNARVAAGFPARRRAPGWLRVPAGSGSLRLPAAPAWTRAQPRMAALGVAASLLIALVVAIGVASGPNGSTTPSAGSGSAAVQKAAPSAVSGASAHAPAVPAPPTVSSPGATSSDSVAVPPPAPVQPGGFVGGSHRKVEQSASLVLTPDHDKLDAVGDQVIAVTDRYHGIVMQSSITNSANEPSSGSFDLRIPIGNLQPALRDLSALADVQSRTENADDVTASFVNARTRLQELTAERGGLLKRLAAATTDQAVAAIRAQLRLVNDQIQAQMDQLTQLRRQTSYASVNVSLLPKQDSSGGGIGSGARDLRDSLIGAANVALRVLGVALPLALLGALFWAANGWLARRRREGALRPN